MDFRSTDPETAETMGRFGRVAAGILFAVLGVISMLSAGVGLTDSFSANPRGRVVFVAVFTLLGVVCSWFAYRLLLDRPRRDGGLMGPVALRATALFFIGLPILSLATGAWKNNHIPFLLVLAQAALYVSWGAALWRLASVRSATRGSDGAL